MSQFCTEIGRLRVEHRIILITESAVLVVLPGRRIRFKLSDPFLNKLNEMEQLSLITKGSHPIQIG